LDVEADLSVQLGRLGRKVDAVGQRLDRPPPQPYFAQIANALKVDGGGDDLVFDMGGPAQGLAWYVLNLVIGGLTWGTTVGGKGLAVVTASTPTTAQSVGLAQVRDEADTLPLPAFYSRGQFALKAPEHLFVIVTGGDAGKQYVVNAVVEEFQEAVRPQVAAV
jgi:hypothetical protein